MTFKGFWPAVVDALKVFAGAFHARVFDHPPMHTRPVETATSRDHADWRFADRREAGKVLASRLGHYRGQPGVVVLALPRGGVPVAFEVAAALEAPLDIFLVRKIGMPGSPEFAIGAVASNTEPVLSDDVIRWSGLSPAAVAEVIRLERTELARREQEYRRDRPSIPLSGRTVILVDDGLATGSTIRAAIRAIRQHEPKRIVVAAPVGARQTCREVAALADEVICARTPEPFDAVGLWYRDFSQTTDAEVRLLLSAR